MNTRCATSTHLEDGLLLVSRHLRVQRQKGEGGRAEDGMLLQESQQAHYPVPAGQEDEDGTLDVARLYVTEERLKF